MCPVVRPMCARRRAWLLAQTGDLQGAEASADRSVAIGRLDGDAAVLGSALVALGTIRRWSGRPLDAVPALSEAVGVATDAASCALDAMSRTGLDVGRVASAWSAALAHLEEASLMFTELRRSPWPGGGRRDRGTPPAPAWRTDDEAIAALTETAIQALSADRATGMAKGVNLTNLSNILSTQAG